MQGLWQRASDSSHWEEEGAVCWSKKGGHREGENPPCFLALKSEKAVALKKTQLGVILISPFSILKKQVPRPRDIQRAEKCGYYS